MSPRAARGPLVGPLLVIVIAFMMQSGSALATKVIGAVGVVDANWLRTTTAALVLIAVRPRSLRLPPPGQRRTVALLALSLLCMNLSFYGAISQAPIGIVVAIEFSGPLVVAVLGSRRPSDFALGRPRGGGHRRARRPEWVDRAGGPRPGLVGRPVLGPVPGARPARPRGARAAAGDDPHLHGFGAHADPGGPAVRATPRAPSVGGGPGGPSSASCRRRRPTFSSSSPCAWCGPRPTARCSSLSRPSPPSPAFCSLGQTLSALDVAAIVTVIIAAAGATVRAASSHTPVPLPPDGGAPL